MLCCFLPFISLSHCVVPRRNITNGSCFITYIIFFSRLIYLSFNSLSPLPISSSYIFLFFSTVCSCVCDMFRFFVVVFEHHINGIAMCAHTHTHHLEQRINNEEKKEWNRTTTTTKKTEDSKSNSKELNGHAKERKLKSSRKQ